MTPGDAIKTVGAVLRHYGYTIEEAAAYPVGDGASVSGAITTLDGLAAGRFTATVRADDTYTIDGGAFGRITEDGDDPFQGL